MARPDRLSGALQESIVAMLVSDNVNCHVVRATIPTKLYSNEIFRNIVSRAYDFIDTHKQAPGSHLVDICDDLITDKDGGKTYLELIFMLQDMSRSINTKYVLNRLNDFVEEHTLRLGIIEAAEALQNENIEEARTLIEDALRRTDPAFDPGLTINDAIMHMQRGEADREVIPLGIAPLDKYHIGPALGEMIIFLGAPKRGKTWALVHAARQGLLHRKRVLYITLEVSAQIIARRIIMSLTAMKWREDARVMMPRMILSEGREEKQTIVRVDQTEITRKALQDPKGLQSAALRIKKLHIPNNLLVKQFSTGTLSKNQYNSYLDQIERRYKFVPELVIIDYPDLMALDRKTLRTSLGGLFTELRGVAVERHHALATASQLNRMGATQARSTEAQVAEDFSKIAVADSVIVINQMEQEKANGLARLYVAVDRNEHDRFSVLMTQSLTTGQFCVRSRMEPKGYMKFVRDSLTDDVRDDDDGEKEIVEKGLTE
jgi:replicative DNA helicase